MEDCGNKILFTSNNKRRINIEHAPQLLTTNMHYNMYVYIIGPILSFMHYALNVNFLVPIIHHTVELRNPKYICKKCKLNFNNLSWLAESMHEVIKCTGSVFILQKSLEFLFLSCFSSFSPHCFFFFFYCLKNSTISPRYFNNNMLLIHCAYVYNWPRKRTQVSSSLSIYRNKVSFFISYIVWPRISF